jgi:hypothetical protein
MYIQSDTILTYSNMLDWFKEMDRNYICLFIQKADEYYMFWNFSDLHDVFYNDMTQVKRSILTQNLNTIIDSLRPGYTLNCLYNSSKSQIHIVISMLANSPSGNYNLKVYCSTVSKDICDIRNPLLS